MKRAHRLYRRSELNRFFPYERTVREQVIRDFLKRGLLKKVVLRPGGRAVAYTEQSIIACQREMGLEPIDDGTGDTNN